MSMLEQLPGAHQLKQYSFKYNPPFDISSLEGTAEQVRDNHGLYNLEKVLKFSCRIENSVNVLEKYLISLFGLEKSLNSLPCLRKPPFSVT